MSETNGRPTLATDVAVPERLVELLHLKARDGSPVRVKVYPISPLMAGRAGLALPGAMPSEVPSGEAQQEEQQKRQNMQLMLDLAAPIIEDCTALSRGDGGEVRPAFRFSADPGESLPGRILHAEDLALLVETAMELAGYGTEVADSTAFRGANRSRRRVGA